MPQGIVHDTGRVRLHQLDGLRTVAALGVMMFHITDIFGASRLFSRTYLFVDLFFLLSGFVLTLAAEPGMRAGRAPLDFVRARIGRLWPLVALGSVAGAAAFVPVGEPGQTAQLLLLGLLMIPLTRPGIAAFPLNGPQWSLCWELVANFLHATLLHRLDQRRLALVAALAGLVLVIFAYRIGGCFMGPNTDNFWLAAPRIAWSYVLGIMMARHWMKGIPLPLTDWRIALCLPMVALLALAWLPIDPATGDLLAVMIVLPALFWVAITAVAPLSATAWLERFGNISFPLYALHLPVIVLCGFISEAPIAKLVAAFVAVAMADIVARRLPMFGPVRQKALV